jgi:hypothetical protein
VVCANVLVLAATSAFPQATWQPFFPAAPPPPALHIPHTLERLLLLVTLLVTLLVPQVTWRRMRRGGPPPTPTTSSTAAPSACLTGELGGGGAPHIAAAVHAACVSVLVLHSNAFCPDRLNPDTCVWCRCDGYIHMCCICSTCIPMHSCYILATCLATCVQEQQPVADGDTTPTTSCNCT